MHWLLWRRRATARSILMTHLAGPRLKFTIDRPLDQTEKIAGRVAHSIALAANRPFVEDWLAQTLIDLLQCHHCPRLLFLLQAGKALRQI